MICIVVGARRFGVNPDNIATPIAASLGDLITLSILALISSFLYRHKGREGTKEPGWELGHHPQRKEPGCCGAQACRVGEWEADTWGGEVGGRYLESLSTSRMAGETEYGVR